MTKRALVVDEFLLNEERCRGRDGIVVRTEEQASLQRIVSY